MVGAFRLATDLHSEREDNDSDEKVSLLVVAMSDMMATLLKYVYVVPSVFVY